MTKTLRAAQIKRGKVVKKKLETILKKIQDIIDDLDQRQMTPDVENMLNCLVEAKLAIENGVEHYTKYL